MSKLFLSLMLLSALFLFSLAPNARAQALCEFPPSFPTGVAFAYKCELDCYNCLVGDPQCKACDRLEIVFPDIERCANAVIPDCEQPPSPNP